MSQEYIAYTSQHAGLTVKIIQDSDASSPEEWETPENGVFLVTTRNRYFESIPEGFDVETIAEHIKDQKRPTFRGYRVFRLRAYIHSGVALSLGGGYPFSDPWDSGQIGWVLVKPNAVHGTAKAAQQCVDTWNQYLSGDVWGYVLESPGGEHEDSCWGFYGLEYAKQEARAAADFHAAEIKKAERLVQS